MKRLLEIGSPKTDGIEEYLNNAYSPVTVRGLGDDRYFGVKGSYARFDDVLLEWSTSIGNYEITPKKEYEAVIFNLMKNKSASYQIRGRTIDLPEGYAIAYRHPDNINIVDQSTHATVTFSNDLLQKRLMVLLDGAHQRNIEFYNEALEREKIKIFWDFVCELEESPILSLARTMCDRTASITDVIADAFLLSFPNNCTDVLSRPVPMVAPRHVKRAIDYIHGNPRNRHSPDDLAALSNVSVRSLQTSFKAVTTHTISEYQTLLRLEHARRDILSNPEIPLSKVAKDWGFGSLGSFGQSFRRLYGVAPSSLRRGG